MRVETKMTNRKEFDIKPYASIENASKCFDNADRLLDDAFKTSLPTRVALMELGIEELSKGLIVLFNVDEPRENASLEKLMGNVELPDNLWSQWIEDYKTKNPIENLNPYNHKDKLKVIQVLFDFALHFGKFILNPNTIKSIEQLLDRRIFGNFILPDFNEISDAIKNINIDEWDKMKEKALYVNFENGNTISPEKIDFKAYTYDIFKVAFISRLLLLAYLVTYEGKGLNTIFSNKRTLLGPFNNLIKTDNGRGRSKRKNR